MKLEYKILWIDNDDKIYKDHQSEIEEYLNDLGFSPIIEKGSDYNAFDKLETDLNQFDLFILDYRLDGPKNGNEIIKDIRDTYSIYTDVIFYSAVKEDLRTRIYEDRLNGVYYTGRGFEEFEEDVLALINVTIKKVQDVNNLRGLIMAEVAELDRIKERIIIQASSKIKDSHLEKYTLKKVKESGTSNKNKAQKFIDDVVNTNFKTLFTEHIGFIDSDKKAKAIGETLDKLNITSPICKVDFIQPYINDILDIRNKFAHIEEQDNMIGDIPFTEERCIKIRKNIKNYKNLLLEIEEQVCVNL